MALAKNEVCSEQHLAEIALWIIEWKEVSPFLGLTQAEEIEIIGSAPHSVRSQKIAMLRLWKQKQGSKATYKRLCRGFRRCGKLDLEEKVIRLLAENSSSSDEETTLGSKSMHSNTSHVDYLRVRYRSLSHSQTPQHWDYLPRCNFIQLTIARAQRLRSGPEEKIVKLSQHGQIDKIMSQEEKITLNQIFKTNIDCDACPPLPSSPLSPSQKSQDDPLESLDLLSLVLPNPRTILIEGAPGGGKSTLALHICHQWAQGASWLAKFDVVILVYLREEGIQNAKTLADIIPARTIEMANGIATQLQATDGGNTLFVFDGWDEFPPELMNNSLVSTIIRQPQKLSLHLSTVIVTSRPSSGNLLQIADRRVEILGFTQQQIRKFIERALHGNSDHIQELVSHLDKHPVIEGCCYVPLHAAILVHIYNTKGALPTTLHELFRSLVLCCIVREHKTHKPDNSLPDLLSFDDLPDDIMSNLRNLSLLAYEGLMQNKIVFNSEDLHLPTDLPSLGLLQVVEGLTLTSKSLSYHFLHLSVQELLAAYHISLMSHSEQVKIFEELIKNEDRFKAVLRYYSGFTKLANPEIREFISSYQYKISSLQNLLPLLYCFFEAQQPSLCQLVGSELQTRICVSYLFQVPTDFLAIGYYVTSLLSSSSANEPYVYLSIDDDITCANLKLLLSELSKLPIGGSPTDGTMSRKLALSLSRHHYDPYGIDDQHDYDNQYEILLINAEEAKNLAFHLKQSSAINVLVVSDGDIQQEDEDGLLYIAEALQTNSSVTKLWLPRMKLQYTEPSGSALTKMLHMNKSLTHLNLSRNIELSDSGAHCIFKGLQYNTSLTHLNLMETGIRATNLDTAQSLTKMLQINKSLTHLDLSNNSFLKTRACCIFKGLQHNTTLTHLSLRNTSLATSNIDTARCLTKILQVNKSLTHLDLSRNGTITDSDACCIFEGLQYNTSLTHLNLMKTVVRAKYLDTARSLTKMLLINKSLTHLDLSYNSFLKSRACCIFKGLQHNTTLTHLSLRNTSLATSNIDTARCLTKMLQVNKSLTHLDLSENNTITDSGACCIFDGLQHNTSLIYLNLSCINVTGTDPNTARSLTAMLQNNKSLVHLELTSKNRSPYFSNLVCLIFEGLQQNVTLAELILYQTDRVRSRSSFSMDSKTANCLSKMLEVNKTLKYLSFSRCLSIPVSYCIFEGAAQLHLNLCGVTINDSDAEHIAEGLKSNTSLQTLKIGAPGFFYDRKNGSQLILELLKTNPRLKTIYTIEASEKDRFADLNAARQEKGFPMVDIMSDKGIPSHVDYDITMYDDSDDYSW